MTGCSVTSSLGQTLSTTKWLKKAMPQNRVMNPIPHAQPPLVQQLLKLAKNDLGKYRPTPTPPPVVYPTHVPSTGGGTMDDGDSSGGGCDPSYLMYASLRTTDLNCGDILIKFRVIGSDPHGFDGIMMELVVKNN